MLNLVKKLNKYQKYAYTHEQCDYYIDRCVGVALAGCQELTKTVLSLSSSAKQGRENVTESSWVEIRTGESLSSYCHVQNRLILWKFV